MGRREQKRPPPALIQHLAGIGFTNRLALYLVALLFLGLAGGFILAVLSIRYQYTGALACYTVVFTPVGTAVSIVLARVVEKNRKENTGADREGITFAAARAADFRKEGVVSENSPPI